MKTIITLITIIALISCQKEITCETWEICPDRPKPCISGHIDSTRGMIDPYNHPMFITDKGVQLLAYGDYIAKHPSCFKVNIPDSAGWYRIYEEMVFTGGSVVTPAVYIGDPALFLEGGGIAILNPVKTPDNYTGVLYRPF